MFGLSANSWDWVYFVTCLVGTVCVPLVFRCDPVTTAICIFGCSFLKEGFDQIYVVTQWKWMLTLGADARGWMVMDNVRAFWGCALGIIVLLVVGIR
jgi:hypothetical protein